MSYKYHYIHLLIFVNYQSVSYYLLVEAVEVTPMSTVEVEKPAPVAGVDVEKEAPSDKPKDYYKVAEAALRVLLLASLVAAVVVMVTSKQTELIPVKVDPFHPPFLAPLTAKFTHSPAFM